MVLRIGRGELPAGGVAAIAFLAFVFPLDLSLWLAAPLAAATYLGVLLVWSPVGERRPEPAGSADTPDERAYEAALNAAIALRVRAAHVTKPDVQARIVRMLEHTDRILDAMIADGNVAAAPVFHEGWLTRLQTDVAEYIRMSARDVKSARARAEKFETCHLARFEAAIDAFDEELNRAPETDLAALREVLQANLRVLDTFGPSEDAPALPAAAGPEPIDASAATESFSPGAAAARSAARHGLTPREHEIVVLLAQRLRNKEIAARLSIAVRTVENHVARILDKLDLDSRDDVPPFASDNGLLPPSDPPPHTPPSGESPAHDSPTPPE